MRALLISRGLTLAKSHSPPRANPPVCNFAEDRDTWLQGCYAG